MPSGENNIPVVVIKKYANRRLYNTETSLYITLDEVYNMVKDKISFEVIEAKSNENITRHILMQIIMEQESKNTGGGLPLDFLKNIICMYESLLQMENMPLFIKEYFDIFIEATSFYQKKTNISPDWWEDVQASQENLWKETIDFWKKHLHN